MESVLPGEELLDENPVLETWRCLREHPTLFEVWGLGCLGVLSVMQDAAWVLKASLNS